ncbi:MAG: class I SAM-dependent methyltransferase [Flavobacteriaceae bacterium]
MKIKNIFIQALKPKRFLVMFKKVFLRLFDKNGNITQKENLKWLESNYISFEKFAKKLDKNLWFKSIKICNKIRDDSRSKLKKIKYDLGGGGFYPLLFFIVKYIKPNIVVETGVAAGFSSYAILKAIDENNKGRLYSSDFPYFRIPNPERFIGIIIPEVLKKHWELFIDGDDLNLLRISKKIKGIDIFHYDSDKSYFGREKALNILKKNIGDNTILIMDDIQDNSFFYDYVLELVNSNWYIFKFEGKYIGVVGNFN